MKKENISVFISALKRKHITKNDLSRKGAIEFIELIESIKIKK